MTVQETMTKEQILESYKWLNPSAREIGLICAAMEEYAQQQLSAERERGQQFPTTEQMDAAINVSIGKMFGGLEAASIDHFLQTGKINGSFRQRLHDCIKSASMLVDIKAKTELLKERERAGKLVGALKSTILIFNKLGYPKTAEFVKQTIAEYDTQTKS